MKKMILFGGRVTFKSQKDLLAAMGTNRIDKGFINRFPSLESMAMFCLNVTNEDECVQKLLEYKLAVGPQPYRASKFKTSSKAEADKVMSVVCVALHEYLAAHEGELAHLGNVYDDLKVIGNPIDPTAIKSYINHVNRVGPATA